MNETPKNIEAEQVVLSGVASGNINIDEIKFEDFYDQRHKKIFEVILKNKTDIPIDSKLIYNSAEKLGLSKEVGLEVYVIDVIDAHELEAKHNGDAWKRKVKEDSRLRQIQREAQQLVCEIGN